MISKNYSNFKNLQHKDLVVVFSCIFVVFMMIMNWVKITDLPAHVGIASDMLQNQKLFTGNFILYFLINLFSGFTGDINTMKIVLCILLAFATTFKYFIVKAYFEKFASKGYSKVIALSLLFVYIIPLLFFLKPFGFYLKTTYLYLGYFVPNVWHNSTIIFLFPFAIWLYLESYKQLVEFNAKRNYLISTLVILNVFIKPSFFFVFLCAYPIMLIIKYRFKYQFWYSIIPIMVGLVSLLIVYMTIYNTSNDESSVIISFDNLFQIQFWKEKAPYILSSLLFPFVYFFSNIKRCINNIEFYYLVLILASAIGIYLVCYETGDRAMHGNFYWQNIIAVWLVFLFIAKNIYNEYLIKGFVLKIKIYFAIYFVHVLMGIAYLIRIISYKDYF